MTILTAEQRRGGDGAQVQTLVRIGRRALAHAEHLEHLADTYYADDEVGRARARADARKARTRAQAAADEMLAIALRSDDLDLRRRAVQFDRSQPTPPRATRDGAECDRPTHDVNHHQEEPEMTTATQPTTAPAEKPDEALAAKEHTAAKAAAVLGHSTPETPNLDKVRKDQEMAKQQTTATSDAKPARAKRGSGSNVALHVARPGKEFSPMAKKVSTLAYFYTAGIDNEPERISVVRFRELVVKAGGDFTKAGWKVTLPNGVVVEAREAGTAAASPTPPNREQSRSAAADASQDKPPVTPGAKRVENTGTHGRPAKPAGAVAKQTPGAKARAAAASTDAKKAPAKKATAKKAPAKKATARKPAARKAPAKRTDQVTPLLKAKDARKAAAQRPTRAN